MLASVPALALSPLPPYTPPEIVGGALGNSVVVVADVIRMDCTTLGEGSLRCVTTRSMQLRRKGDESVALRFRLMPLHPVCTASLNGNDVPCGRKEGLELGEAQAKLEIRQEITLTSHPRLDAHFYTPALMARHRLLAGFPLDDTVPVHVGRAEFYASLPVGWSVDRYGSFASLVHQRQPLHLGGVSVAAGVYGADFVVRGAVSVGFRGWCVGTLSVEHDLKGQGRVVPSIEAASPTMAFLFPSIGLGLGLPIEFGDVTRVGGRGLLTFSTYFLSLILAVDAYPQDRDARGLAVLQFGL